MRVERERKSAKGTIVAYAEELLKRLNDPESEAKLLAIQTIALRMNWNDLYTKLYYRARKQPWWTG